MNPVLTSTLCIAGKMPDLCMVNTPRDYTTLSFLRVQTSVSDPDPNSHAMATWIRITNADPNTDPDPGGLQRAKKHLKSI
jgi:hypothetical protein